ncbi:MAG: hypothetical protein ACPHK8_06925 [Thermoplasmatota archaeon]
MTIKKSRTALFAVLAIFVAAAVLVPTASAQATQLELKVATPNSKLVTGGTPGKATLTLTYTGSNSAQAVSTVAQNSLPVALTNSCNDQFVNVVGPSSAVIPLNPQDQLSTGFGGTTTVDLTISASPGAKGLTDITCTSTASAGALPGLANAPTTSPLQWIVTVDYLSILSVKVDGQIAESGPQKTTQFPITVRNLGNAQSNIYFETTTRPEDERWVDGVPDKIVLNADWAADGQVDTVQYSIISTYKTGWNNVQGKFTVTIRPEATSGAVNGVLPTGSAVTANMIVKVKGVFVPGFEPLAMVAAVVGSALIARRSQDEE